MIFRVIVIGFFQCKINSTFDTFKYVIVLVWFVMFETNVLSIMFL